MKRLENSLGKSKAPDGIQEGPWWNSVMSELNAISKECARELQSETNSIWNKGSYITGLDEAPPTRLLALEIALAGWLGWTMH